MSYYRWSLLELERLVAQGTSDEEIAEMKGVTVLAVALARHRFKIPAVVRCERCENLFTVPEGSRRDLRVCPGCLELDALYYLSTTKTAQMVAEDLGVGKALLRETARRVYGLGRKDVTPMMQLEIRSYLRDRGYFPTSGGFAHPN